MCFIETKRMFRFLLALVTIAGVIANVSNSTSSGDSCFPFGSATLNKDFSKPSMSRSEWWCSQNKMYGFMGFSYPLEVPDCNDWSNSYDAINADFAQMKRDFGARMVRVYAPECRENSIWEHLLRAGVENNMAVIPQVWWGFGDVRKTIMVDIQTISNKYIHFLTSSSFYAAKPMEENSNFYLQHHEEREVRCDRPVCFPQC